MFYECQGDGRPIVMLPGRPSDHRIMEPAFAHATAGCGCIPICLVQVAARARIAWQHTIRCSMPY